MDARNTTGRHGAAPGQAAGSPLPAEPGRNCAAPLAGRAGIRIPPFRARQGYSANGGSALADFLEFGALVSAVPCARLHARQVLWEWGLASLGESAGLLVTELFSNAVKASRAARQACPVRLWLMSDRAQILILVWDASPEPPVRLDANGETENGRGLMLVEAISTQCGWYHDGSGGKFVWAVL